MSKRTILVCDLCGSEVSSGGATVTARYTDLRRGQRQADFCDTCADKLPGVQTARRGRKPKID